MKKFIVIILIVLFVPSALFARKLYRVNAVVLKGLKYLSKYEIINKTSFKGTDKGIVVDTDSLRKSLSENLFIENYDIVIKNNKMVISVSEKRPHRIVVVRRKEQLIPLELDRDFTVISVNKVHSKIKPLVYIDQNDITNHTVSVRVKNIYTLLNEIKMEFKSLYREITEVHIDSGTVKVRLRGRKTIVTMRPEKNQFKRLQYLVGYFDKIGRYPAEVLLSQNRALVR